MNAIRETAQALETAIRVVSELTVVTRDAGASVQPPAAIVGPPQLTWDTGCADPTAATFLVYVVVRADKHAVERLWDLLPAVSSAIDETDFAVVTEAAPAAFPVGAVDLPAYEITVECAL